MIGGHTGSATAKTGTLEPALGADRRALSILAVVPEEKPLVESEETPVLCLRLPDVDVDVNDAAHVLQGLDRRSGSQMLLGHGENVHRDRRRRAARPPTGSIRDYRVGPNLRAAKCPAHIATDGIKFSWSRRVDSARLDVGRQDIDLEILLQAVPRESPRSRRDSRSATRDRRRVCRPGHAGMPQLRVRRGSVRPAPRRGPGRVTRDQAAARR